jgi:hypothetical protein
MCRTYPNSPTNADAPSRGPTLLLQDAADVSDVSDQELIHAYLYTTNENCWLGSSISLHLDPSGQESGDDRDE